MTLRIINVFDDHDKDGMDIIFNHERGTAQVVECDRRGVVTASSERPMSEMLIYLRNALRQAGGGLT